MNIYMWCVLSLISCSLFLTSCSKEKGCMDPNAANYNALAEKDDGSCIYGPIIEQINHNIYSCEPPFWIFFTIEGL